MGKFVSTFFNKVLGLVIILNWFSQILTNNHGKQPLLTCGLRGLNTNMDCYTNLLPVLLLLLFNYLQFVMLHLTVLRNHVFSYLLVMEIVRFKNFPPSSTIALFLDVMQEPHISN